MNEGSHSEDHEEYQGWHDRPSFLGSHRALAVCTREVGRLVDEVQREIVALHAGGLADKPDIRLSPSRCIVQLGPVALTVTWLRQTLDSVADGELLVMVWRGLVAPHRQHTPERVSARPATTATVLWEHVFSAAADDEESWRWQASSEGEEFTSSALAGRCVARLRQAYAENASAA
ncbi:MAG TPA: hypothetical protein VFK13_08865 [Gemmatimonadaceae bacterium]|nr:hypothetical protein [Gemmatimonadaceae bacterium]